MFIYYSSINKLNGMADSRRGVKSKILLYCPNCKSNDIVINGHYHNGKPQFFCKKCYKYFYENSLKGYPPTAIPFPIIAYFLYFRRKVPEFSNMRKFRKFVDFWLKNLKIKDKEASRHIINHWIKNYDSYLDNVITFSESRDYVRQHVSKVLSPVKPISYGRALVVLENKFGKAFCINLARSDPVFFRELCDSVSKYGVFGWEFLEAGFGGGSVGHRSASTV